MKVEERVKVRIRVKVRVRGEVRVGVIVIVAKEPDGIACNVFNQ